MKQIYFLNIIFVILFPLLPSYAQASNPLLGSFRIVLTREHSSFEDPYDSVCRDFYDQGPQSIDFTLTIESYDGEVVSLSSSPSTLGAKGLGILVDGPGEPVPAFNMLASTLLPNKEFLGVSLMRDRRDSAPITVLYEHIKEIGSATCRLHLSGVATRVAVR